MTELQIYQQGGLFHNIVKASKVMSGNYHVLPTGTSDLNPSNITGLQMPEQGKFPMVACLAPVSTMKPDLQNGQWEELTFRLLFLDTTGRTSRGNVMLPDLSTNLSMETIAETWQEMKTVAFSFLNTLDRLGLNLRGKFRLDDSTKWRFFRIAKQQKDEYSGIMVQFGASLATTCDFQDITRERELAIVIPN